MFHFQKNIPPADYFHLPILCQSLLKALLSLWGGAKNAGAIDNLVIGNSPEYLREELQNMIENLYPLFRRFCAHFTFRRMSRARLPRAAGGVDSRVYSVARQRGLKGYPAGFRRVRNRPGRPIG